MNRAWTRRSLPLALALLAVGCGAEHRLPEPLQVVVDADSSVRMHAVEITVVLETVLEDERGEGSEVWETITQQRRELNATRAAWPWEFEIDPEHSDHARYSLTGVARDASGAVIALARVVRTLEQAQEQGLRVHFESSQSDDVETRPSPSGEPSTGRPIARECMGREPNVPFCDGETMRVCGDGVAEVRPCGEFERCFVRQSVATCGCRPGYVIDEGRCREVRGCETDNGGCDPLTECSLSGRLRTCGPCPSGYAGDGIEGCAPLLQALSVSAGALEPAFAPSTREYRVRVPPMTPQIVLTPAAPLGATVAVDGQAIDANDGWTSAVLVLGETRVEIDVTSSGGVTTRYQVKLDRPEE